MNTDREYCIGTDCPKKDTCRRYVEYPCLPYTLVTWLTEPIACRESGYGNYVEKREGVWHIKNYVDEYNQRITSYYPTLREAIEGLMESSNWFEDKGTGEIYFHEYGINGKDYLVFAQ